MIQPTDNIGFSPDPAPSAPPSPKAPSGGPAVAATVDDGIGFTPEGATAQHGSIDEQMNWSKQFAGVDYAKNKMGDADKANFSQLAKVTDNSADAQKQAINMAYVSKLLPNIPLSTLQQNWPAARQAFAASALGMSDGDVSDGKLYDGINERVNANLQQHWATASTFDRLKMMFGSRGYGDNMPVEGDPILGSEAAGTKGTLATIPKMDGSGVFAGLINGVNRFSSSLTSPDNVALAVGTAGVGDLATLAKEGTSAAVEAGEAVQAIRNAKIAVAAKAAQAGVVGTFAGQGAAGTKDAVASAKLVWNDPHSTTAAKTEAIVDVVMNAAMTAAAAKGTYDIGAEAKADFEKRPVAGGEPGQTEDAPTPEKAQADEARQVQVGETLRDAANSSPKGEIKDVLTEAAMKEHPHSENGPQITETDSGFVVTDALGNHLDTVKTMEEARRAVDTANGVETPPSPKESPEMAPGDEADTTGISQRTAEARGVATEPGQGVSGELAVEHGRELLAGGFDVDKALSDFSEDPNKQYDTLTAGRARLAELAKEADTAADDHGLDSPEYKAARQAEADMVEKLKPLSTAAHKEMMAHQGETEIDTGTYHGMARAVRDAVGERGVSESEAAKQDAGIKERVATVKDLTKGEEKSTKEVSKAMKEAAKDDSGAEPVAPKKSSVSKYLDNKISEAMERIKARQSEGRVNAGLDPEDLADHAIVGAGYIAKGVATFGEWSKEMVKQFGDYIKPHLQDLFERSKEAAKEAERQAPAIEHKVGEKWTPEQAKALWKRGAELMDSGVGYDDMRHQLAKEYGLPVNEITKGIASDKNVRRVTDEMYQKMSLKRDAIKEAKNWVKDQKYPGWVKAAKGVPHFFFNLATFGHGTSWFSSHASANLFVPKATGMMVTELGRAFRMMGDRGYHEQMMADLVRDPNFVMAKRAGLANDPHKFTDDYQSASVVKQFKDLGLIGNRGFDGLKLLRQFRFNQEWSSLPPELQNTTMAKYIAETINKATGHGDVSRVPGVLKAPFFAPGLFASKMAMLFKDPVTDAATLVSSLYDKKSVSPERSKIAQTRMKFALTGVGTYLSALTLNQALLSATGSDQKVNFTDPTHGGDWLRFKGFGLEGSPVAPLLKPFEYLANLAHAFWGQRSKFEQSQGSRVGEAYDKTGQYARGQLAPFYGIAADAVTGSDFRGNTMPWNNDKIPSFQARNGVHQYSTAEYGATHMLPIPMEDAAKEVWTKQGIGGAQQKEWLKAMRDAFISGTTGSHVSEDTSNHREPTQPAWMERLLPSGNSVRVRSK